MQQRKLTGLFINCPEAQDSIFESGKMAFQCLLNSDYFSLDYCETNFQNRTISTGYDFYLFNYHNVTMSWLDTKLLKSLFPGVKMTVVLEIAPNDPFVYCSPDDFDVYVALDPTLENQPKNVYAFPRPLEAVENPAPYQPKDIPLIGSFGFATKGKGFEHLIEAVNREFDRATVKINIPFASYADSTREYAEYLSARCLEKARKGIDVIVTHDFMSKAELIKWCGENTINCFLYDRNMPGLAATTDQAISSGRPLIISKNDTFRHIEKFITPYPQQTLKEAIENTQEKVWEIQREWSPENFRRKFENVLLNLSFDEAHPGKAAQEKMILPAKKDFQPTFARRLKNKLAVKTRFGNFVKGKGLVK